MYQRLLVPIDGSETSMNGLHEAIMLAKTGGSRICILHIVNDFIFVGTYGIDIYAGDVINSIRDAGRKIVQEAVAEVRLQGMEPESVSLECVGGSIAALILDQAKKWSADLIVMGTHGRRGLRRLAMGSDAESVVRDTTIPVLLVHGPAHPATVSTSSRFTKEATGPQLNA